MHVIERTERFTLIGADVRRGKLTLFEAEGPREQGVLGRIGLRVSSLAGREPVVDLGEGLEVLLVEGETDIDFSTSTTSASSPGSRRARRRRRPSASSESGRRGSRSAFVELLAGDPGTTERPLLNHMGVLVDSVGEHIAGAEEWGIEIDEVVDAPNTLAVFRLGARPRQARVRRAQALLRSPLTRLDASPVPAWPASSPPRRPGSSARSCRAREGQPRRRLHAPRAASSGGTARATSFTRSARAVSPFRSGASSRSWTRLSRIEALARRSWSGGRGTRALSGGGSTRPG